LGGGKQIRQKDRDEAKVSLKNRERVEVSLTVEARRQNLFNFNMALLLRLKILCFFNI